MISTHDLIILSDVYSDTPWKAKAPRKIDNWNEVVKLGESEIKGKRNEESEIRTGKEEKPKNRKNEIIKNESNGR